MATITPTRLANPLSKRGLRIWKWAEVDASDDCTPVLIAGFTDKTVFFLSAGAFGGSLTFEVSPEPVTASARYVTAKNAEAGAAISGVAAEAAHTILTHGYLGRPTAGAGVSNVDVYLVLATVR